MNKSHCICRSFLNSCFLLCLALGISGCASEGGGPSFVLVQPKPNEAIIYHYRTYAFAGSAVAYDVMSNDQPLTQIGKVGFFEQSVTPGLINYRTKRQYHSGLLLVPIALQTSLADAIQNSLEDFKQAYSFQAEPGKVYFFRWQPTRGGLPKITPVQEADALRDLSKLQSFPPSQSK